MPKDSESWRSRDTEWPPAMPDLLHQLSHSLRLFVSHTSPNASLAPFRRAISTGAAPTKQAPEAYLQGLFPVSFGEPFAYFVTGKADLTWIPCTAQAQVQLRRPRSAMGRTMRTMPT